MELECEGLQGTAVRTNDDGVRGLYAIQDFVQGEYLCAIPLTACLALDGRGRASCKENKDPLQLTSLETEINCTLHFLSDFGDDSFWKPYLDCLPRQGRQFDPTPDYWPDNLLHMIEIPSLIQATRERRQALEQQEATEQFTKDDGYFDRLCWANWIVRTRGLTSVQCASDSHRDSSRILLIPWVDMINHHFTNPNAELEWLVGESDETTMIALKASNGIAAGEEINISYGLATTSLDLLDRYGFWGEGQYNPANDYMDWDRVVPEWTTSLDEDVEQLQQLQRETTERSNHGTILLQQQVLKFRIHLKEMQNGHVEEE